MRDLLTVKEASRRLKLAESTVRQLARGGQIRAAKIGNRFRFAEDDVAAYIRSSYLERICQSTDAKTQPTGLSISTFLASREYGGRLEQLMKQKRSESTTSSTWHVMSGTPLSVLKELGSWASFSMVDNYTHLSVSHLAQYANNSLPK